MIYFMSIAFWETTIDLETYTYYPPRSEFISRDSVFRTWVMVVPEQGEFEWQTQDEQQNLLDGKARFGELFCTFPGMPFNRHVTSDALTYHVFQWSFAMKRDTKVLFPPGTSPIHDIPRLTSSLEIAKSLHGKVDAWSRKRTAHLLEEFLHLAWQSHIKPVKVTDSAMLEAARLLRERAGAAFSMEEISSAFYLSAVQFTRRFRAAHGCNPIEFLTQIRLEMAQRLLIETSLSLDEIAFRCGWSSGTYLSHVFNRRLATTPGNFRATHRI